MINKLTNQFVEQAKESVTDSINDTLCGYFPLAVAGAIILSFAFGRCVKPRSIIKTTYLIVDGAKIPVDNVRRFL